MVYAFVQDVPLDEAGYRRVMATIGSVPLKGQLLHLCVRRDDGGLRYIDLWDSEENCTRAFDDRIHDAVDAAFGGARPGTEPAVRPLDIIDATGSLSAGIVLG
jgi:hypothetical protein